mmetsp:Transcript_26965/g.23849  ORF Transcript_26965/g.23849 Transcript_26965/m.23849 type:complete len:116 (+) Transcript_26965:315-662(+)
MLIDPIIELKSSLEHKYSKVFSKFNVFEHLKNIREKTPKLSLLESRRVLVRDLLRQTFDAGDVLGPSLTNFDLIYWGFLSHKWSKDLKHGDPKMTVLKKLLEVGELQTMGIMNFN